MKKKIIFVLLLLIISISPSLESTRGSLNYQNSEELENSFLISGGNSLIQVAQPAFYASITPSAKYIYGIEVPHELYYIIKCESQFDAQAVNQTFGESGGMGLAQLIPSTVKYCEEKLGEEIDPFNPQDNLKCALWLYENEGTRHWGTATSYLEGHGIWGSWHCFAPKLQLD